jgi:hypothetical protein
MPAMRTRTEVLVPSPATSTSIVSPSATNVTGPVSPDVHSPMSTGQRDRHEIHSSSASTDAWPAST